MGSVLADLLVLQKQFEIQIFVQIPNIGKIPLIIRNLYLLTQQGMTAACQKHVRGRTDTCQIGLIFHKTEAGGAKEQEREKEKIPRQQVINTQWSLSIPVWIPAN